MVAVRRRRRLVGVYLHLFSADSFGVILLDGLSSADTDTAAEGDSKDELLETAVRGRLRPGDGGQIMLGMASGDIWFVGSGGAMTRWLARRASAQ